MLHWLITWYNCLLQGTTVYRRPSDAAPQGTAPRALIFNLQRGRGRALRAGGFLRAAAAAAGRLGAAQPGQRALGTPGSQSALGTPEPGPSVCRFRPSYPKWRDARALVCSRCWGMGTRALCVYFDRLGFRV